MKVLLDRIRKALMDNHDPVRAKKEKSYLKSPHKFYGVNVPTLRGIAKDISREMSPVTHAPLLKLTKKLWDSEFHQEKSIAIYLLALHPEVLRIKDMPRIERMMKECTGWDHLDNLATAIVSRIIEDDPTAYAYLEKWAGSDNMWVRRAALLSQVPLLRKGQGDRDLFFRLADGMLHEKEFFIRKAIGWTIREVAKSDPDAACKYLISIKSQASGLTIREGAKRLPENLRNKLA